MDCVTLSQNAIAQLKLITAKGATKKILRLTVDSGGCSGFQYHFDLADAPHAGDLVFTYDDATIAVDDVSLEFVKGAEVDYVQELIGAAFVIKNPNAASSCGCGSSFTV